MSSSGKVMIFMAWIGAAVLLSWLFSQQLDRRENPNQAVETRRSGEVVEVALTQNHMGHYVASGRINDRGVRFIVDTGATHVALGRSLADRLGLERGARGYARTANGTVATRQAVLETVTLGGIEINDVTATITPRMPGDDVLLGMSFLKQLEMTQRGDQLILRHAER